MLKKLRLFTAAIFVLFTVSCYYDKEELLYTGSNCSGVDAKFSTTVSAIIQSRCAIPGCHDAASTNIGGPFTNFTQVKNKAAHIKFQVATGLMPQGSSLTAAERKSISCWVDSGAPNN